MQASDKLNREKSLQLIFEDSFVRFLKNERALITNGTHEQSLCNRLAAELEVEVKANGFDNYRVDAEYNRNYGKPKKIRNGEGKNVRKSESGESKITCDVIVHSRGENPKRDNLIAIEMKKAIASKKKKDDDRERLIALTKPSDKDDPLLGTNPKFVCGYELGCFLDIDSNAETALVEIYRGGVLVESFTQNFDGTVEERVQH